MDTVCVRERQTRVARGPPWSRLQTAAPLVPREPTLLEKHLAGFSFAVEGEAKRRDQSRFRKRRGQAFQLGPPR